MTIEQASLRNRLLSFLSPADFALLQPHLKFVDLLRLTVLAEAGKPHSHVFFIESGLASQVATGDRKRKLEVGIYGRDGVGPASAILGVDQGPHLHFMQIAGDGHRLPTDALRAAMNESITLRDLMLRYVQATMVQVTHTAMSNGSADIPQRLARWLLMSQDRVDGDDVRLTHEFLSVMLGVRRAGVTQALHILEGQRLISNKRSVTTILDRAKLEEVAGASYGVPEAEYERLLGPMK